MGAFRAGQQQMRKKKDLSRLKSRNWVTLNFVDTGDTFAFTERRAPGAFHKISRMVSFFAVVVLVTGAILIAALKLVLGDLDIISLYHVAIGVCLFLSLYVVATLGSNAEFGFDRAVNEIWICRRNSKSQARLKIHFGRHDIQSVEVQQLNHSDNEAILKARFRGKIFPTTVLRGSMDDISAAHSIICNELKIHEQPSSFPG